MRLNLAKPIRRDGTASLQFVKRIPTDLKGHLAGKTIWAPVGGETVEVKITAKSQSIRFSLKTSNVREAKVRQAEALSYIEQWLEAQRSQRPIELTRMQAMALTGEFYKRKTTGEVKPGRNYDGATGTLRPLGDDEYEAELMRNVAGWMQEQYESGGPTYLENKFGKAVDEMLSIYAIPAVTASSRQMLLAMFNRVSSEALLNDAKIVSGDFSPDPNLAKFPDLEPITSGSGTATRRAGSKLSLTGLVEDWWSEAKAGGMAEGTYDIYSTRFRALSAFLGHDDALRVTPQDIVRYKDHRLTLTSRRTGKRVTGQTIRTGDLAAFKTVFGWAVSNRKLELNPASGVSVKMGRKVRLRERDFTEAEATAILKLANEQAHVPEPDQVDHARRWVPWLCAYTGARVGEILQLRREDVRMEGESPVIRITPEAGTVKGKAAREVPLHAHLVEMGIMDYVERYTGDEYLFVTASKKARFSNVVRGRLARVSALVRTVVPDPNVAPNHGWRHTFKTRGFEVDIQEKVLDAICGHAPRSVGQAYGTVTLKTKIDAMAKFPRYEVGGATSGQSARASAEGG